MHTEPVENPFALCLLKHFTLVLSSNRIKTVPIKLRNTMFSDFTEGTYLAFEMLHLG